MRAALVFTIMLGACSNGTDVVARISDTEAIKSSGGRPRPLDANCESPTTLTVLTKAFDVIQIDLLAERSFKPVSLKGCSETGPGPLAVDRGGNLWTASGHTIIVSDPSGHACKTMPLKVVPTAMTFVWDPKLGREVLYAIEDGALFMLDPAADGYTTTPIGTLKPSIDDVRSLAGTADGKLFALAGDSIISISRVNTEDATVDPLWITKNPDGTRFVGGVPNKNGFELVFGANAFAFDTASGEPPQLHLPLFANDPSSLYVAAPPCFLLEK